MAAREFLDAKPRLHNQKTEKVGSVMIISQFCMGPFSLKIVYRNKLESRECSSVVELLHVSGMCKSLGSAC